MHFRLSRNGLLATSDLTRPNARSVKRVRALRALAAGIGAASAAAIIVMSGLGSKPAMAASPPVPDTLSSPPVQIEDVAARKRLHAGQKVKPIRSDPMKPAVHAMEITVVRSNEPGCEPNCAEWLSADGTIDQKSPLRLKKVLARLGGRKLPLFINSPGGSVDDAIAMAAIVRARGLDVVVARTELQTCGSNDSHCLSLMAKAVRLGSPAGLARCASSCPFVLAGGVRRMIGAGAYVGVHRAATYRVMTRVLRTYKVVPRYEWGIPVGTARKLVAEKPVSQSVKPVETSKETYDKIEANFVSMGVSREIMKPMLATSNSEMRWLSPVEIGEFNLATDRLNGQQIVERARVKPREMPAGDTATRTGQRTEALSPPVPMPAEQQATPSAPPAGPFSFGLPITVAPAAGR